MPSNPVPIAVLLFFSLAVLGAADAPALTPQPLVLKAPSFQHYIDEFNKYDNELYRNFYPNAKAWDFLKDNIPLLDCPDQDIALTYYFRWWTYRKHIRQTPAGFVVDEFLPTVDWAAKYNTINCAAGHHIREGRWLADPKYMDDYIAFWFTRDASHRYSFWAADSVWQRSCVSGDFTEAVRLLPDLIGFYQGWERNMQQSNGLFIQWSDRDGMEFSRSGNGYRPTINSYQFGDAAAIARIADLAGQPDVAKKYCEKAAKLKELVQTKLWNVDQQFFETGRSPEGFGLFRCRINDDPVLSKAAKVTASAPGSVACLNDETPLDTCYDYSKPRYNFDLHRGTEEWIQYDLAAPAQVASLALFIVGGESFMPQKFRVTYRQNGEWREARVVKSDFFIPDGGWIGKWSHIEFAPVQTDSVKMELTLCGADRSRVALADVREQVGFTPWYFNMPDPQFSVAWKQVMDPQGFFAPLGLTTLEQRGMKYPLGQVKEKAPKLVMSYGGPSCTWSGPSWPYSTSITLSGLANLLNGPAQDAIGVMDYFKLLGIYAKAQRLTLDDGRVVPWIDEDQNPMNGDWIARCILISEGARNPYPERGKDYNHSTFCDLVIEGLIGLRPRRDETVEVHPLVPEGTWDYFCLDQIRYHGHWLTILFDKDGKRYGKGKGLRVFAEGKEIARSEKVEQITGKLPATIEK